MGLSHLELGKPRDLNNSNRQRSPKDSSAQRQDVVSDTCACITMDPRTYCYPQQSSIHKDFMTVTLFTPHIRETSVLAVYCVMVKYTSDVVATPL